MRGTLALLALLLLVPVAAHADTEAAPALDHFEKARIVEAAEPVTEIIPGTDVTHEVQ